MQVTARTHDLKTHITFISNTQQFMPLHSNLSSINLFMYIYICKCILSDINTALQLCMHKVNFVPYFVYESIKQNVPWVLWCALDTRPSVVYSKPSAARCNSHRTWSCPRFSSCRLNRTKSGPQTVNIQ